jgi:hypothetical protein
VTGYNHHPDCSCGWCIGGWRNHGTRVHPRGSGGWPGSDATLQSYVDTNATCPVCRAAVFFYRSPDGGRVFFDELGPPWPKHPCTDNPAQPTRSAHPSATGTRDRPSEPRWRSQGWVPIRIEDFARAGEWARLGGRRLDNQKSFVRLTPWRNGMTTETPVLVQSLDAFGLGRVAWLARTPAGVRAEEDILAHRAYARCPMLLLRAALAGDAACGTRVGRAVSLDWGERRSPGQPPFYPDHVDWSFAERWFRRAADAGDGEARALLKQVTDSTRARTT